MKDIGRGKAGTVGCAGIVQSLGQSIGCKSPHSWRLDLCVLKKTRKILF